MEGKLALAQLHIFQHGNSDLLEIENLKREANRSGYGLIALKVDIFLKSLLAAQ
jgi:hypothetical protein